MKRYICDFCGYAETNELTVGWGTMTVKDKDAGFNSESHVEHMCAGCRHKYKARLAAGNAA